MSEEFLTRRQLREREQAAATERAEPVQLSRRELRDRERAIQERLEQLQQPLQPTAVEIPQELFPAASEVRQPIIEQAPQTDFVSAPDPFIDDSNPGTIPTQIIRRNVSSETNSIILPGLPDITESTFTVGDGSIVVRTGAIDLPSQQAAVTGEITLITQPVAIDASRADEVFDTDSGKVGVIGIQPVAARELPKRNRERVFPGRLRKGWGTVYLVLAVALVMSAIGALVFLLYTSKII